MLTKTNSRAGGAGAVEREAWECGRFTGSSLKNQHTTLRADLSGDNECRAIGLMARSTTPTISMCRSLIAAGLDPDQALAVYRDGILALRVRSIREAAGLEINGDGTGFRPRRKPDAAPQEGFPRRVGL